MKTKIFVKTINCCAECPNINRFLNGMEYSTCNFTGHRIPDITKIEEHCQLMDKAQFCNT